MFSRSQPCPLRVLLPLAFLALLVLPAVAQETPASSEPADKVVEDDQPSFGRGSGTYHRYCRSCHGAKALGDGTVAPYLKVAPTDLTRLAADNGGEFPTERVRLSIDGREEMPILHGRDMPFWGAVFQADEGQTEADAQRRLADLIAYLQEIQIVDDG